MRKIAFEPKRTNKWILNLPETLNLPSWLITETTRPIIIVRDTIIEYAPLFIKFSDPIGPSTAEALFSMVQDNTKTFDYTLELVDPTNLVIEKWEINGCKIIGVDFGELSKKKSETVECVLTIKPNEVKLKY